MNKNDFFIVGDIIVSLNSIESIGPGGITADVIINLKSGRDIAISLGVLNITGKECVAAIWLALGDVSKANVSEGARELLIRDFDKRLSHSESTAWFVYRGQ